MVKCVVRFCLGFKSDIVGDDPALNSVSLSKVVDLAVAPRIGSFIVFDNPIGGLSDAVVGYFGGLVPGWFKGFGDVTFGFQSWAGRVVGCSVLGAGLLSESLVVHDSVLGLCKDVGVEVECVAGFCDQDFIITGDGRLNVFLGDVFVGDADCLRVLCGFWLLGFVSCCSDDEIFVEEFSVRNGVTDDGCADLGPELENFRCFLASFSKSKLSLPPQ